MTKSETAAIINILMATYSDQTVSKDILEAKVLVWQKVFADIPFQEVQQAVLAFISTDTSGKFMPTPGMIRESVSKLRSDTSDITADEAWDLIMKAVRRSILYSVEEFEKLPEICRKLVGSPMQLKEWAMSENFNPGVEKSLFTKSYNVKREQKREEDKLPEAVRALLGKAMPGVRGIGNGTHHR